MSLASRSSVTVRAPARLHMGFLDLNGGLGRRYGSLGVALEELGVRLRAMPAATVEARGAQAARAAEFARRALEVLGLDTGVHIDVLEAIPDHAGLGSGTQLALAVGAAVGHLHGVDWPARDIARALGRGGRSGIGLGLFDRGGFLVDGGRRGDRDEPPTVVSRMDFPAAWRFVLVFDPGFRGLHGEAERRAFAELPEFSEANAGRLCRLALLGALPALAERDARGFGAAVEEIQNVVGDHFAPAQGGRYASGRVARALDWLRARGAVGVGQSSWGPTGFALADSEVAAHALVRDLRADAAGDGLTVQVCAARNRGAEIEFESRASRVCAG